MTEIPDVWPPEEDPRPASILPMFPLKGVFLLPRQILPLHVFEPRYRQMIDDVLDGQGRLAMGTVLEGQEPTVDGEEELAPRILHVSGVGEIARPAETGVNLLGAIYGTGEHDLVAVLTPNGF